MRQEAYPFKFAAGISAVLVRLIVASTPASQHPGEFALATVVPKLGPGYSFMRTIRTLKVLWYAYSWFHWDVVRALLYVPL